MGSSVFPAAASGPTLAEIQTAVSTYSKGPLDITWTNLGKVNPNGTTTQTITGLSGYKYLKLYSSNVYFPSHGSYFFIRFNGDSTANAYTKLGAGHYGSGTIQGNNSIDNRIQINPGGAGTAQSQFAINITNPNSTTSYKIGDYQNSAFDGSANQRFSGTFLWYNTAAITSVTISSSGGNNFVTDSLITDGFYVIGGN